MKRISSFAAIAALALGLGACTKDAGNEPGGTTGNTAFQFTVKNAQGGNYVTYADIATTPEATLNTIDVYIFDGSGNKIGSNTDFTTSVNATTGETTFTASDAWIAANIGEPITAYFVGNGASANIFSATQHIDPSITTKAAFVEQLAIAQELDAADSNRAKLLTTPLLFSGSGTTTVPVMGKVTIPVQLKRREARFDIVNPVASSFVIKSVVVKNANTQGNIFADAVGGATTTKANLKEITTIPAYDVNNIAAGVFYLYPTKLGGTDTDISILASINGAPDEAYSVASTVAIEANKRYKLVLDPAELTFSVVPEDYDEGSELKIAKGASKIVSFSAGAGTGTITGNTYELIAGENATLQLVLGAPSTTGFDVSVTGTTGVVNAAAIAATESIGPATYAAAYFPVTYNIATTYATSTPGTEVIITFTDSANPANSISVMLYDGNIDPILAKSNSYMVAPSAADAVVIPISRAYDHWTTGLANDAIFNAQFVWTDAPGGMSASGAVKNAFVKFKGNGALLYVEPGSATGNAVVAVSVGGQIKWSWHIWVTNYDPNTATVSLTDAEYPATNGSVWRYTSSTIVATIAATGANVFMDRNLGALSGTSGDVKTQGLLYQWGRKDPFMGKTNWIDDSDEPDFYDAAGNVIEVAKLALTATPNAGVPNNFEYSINNPLTFLIGATNIALPWYSAANTIENDLWGYDGTTTYAKSMYDPCPVGWAVPKAGAFNGLVRTASNIYQFSWDASITGARQYGAKATLGYYPAAGFRASGTGRLANPNTVLHMWTSGSRDNAGTKQEAYEYRSSTGSHTVNSPVTPNNGYSVRCVKE